MMIFLCFRIPTSWSRAQLAEKSFSSVTVFTRRRVYTPEGLRVINSFRTGLKQHANICHGSLVFRPSTRTCFLC